MTRQNRRRFLTAAGAAGLSIGLAGCTDTVSDYTGFGDDGSSGDGPQPAEGGDGGGGGRTITDFSEGLDNWFDMDSNGEFEEATDVRNGERGIRLLADEGESYVGAALALDEPIDLTGQNVSISLRTASPQVHRVEVQLLAPDEGNMARLNRTNTGPADAWMNIDLGTTDERGEPELSEVRELRLIGRDRGQELPIDMVVDEIGANEAPDKGRVVLTWDDSHESHWDAFEIMEEYGFPGVDGVITHAVGARNHLDTRQLDEMQSAGWDIISHPHHPETGSTPLVEENLSEDEQRELIESSIDWLESNGFEEGAKHYVAPGQLRDATNLELLREYHESATSFGGANTGLPLTDTHTIGRFQGRDPEEVREEVDFAEKYNQASVVLWQKLGDGDDADIAEDEFRGVLDHIDQADVEVVTISDLVGGST